MVNSVNNTTGISSYPQSFQDLIQKPQNSAPQGAQPTAAEGDKVTISKKSKGKKNSSRNRHCSCCRIGFINSSAQTAAANLY